MNSEKKEIIKAKTTKEFPEFIDMLNGSDRNSLEKNLSIYAKHREETELAKAEDEGLATAKETAKELAAPYRDALKALKLKLAYINILIEERKDLDG